MNTSTQQLYDRCKANPYMANDAEFMEALRQMVKDAESVKELRSLITEAIESHALNGVNQECCGYGAQTSLGGPPECCCDPHDLEYRMRVAINLPFVAAPFVVEDDAAIAGESEG